MTSYFEDQVNGIGFWDSLVTLNMTQFGKRLPFFDAKTLQQQEEDYEDILPADLHYLAFITYLNLVAGDEEDTFVFFNKPFFIDLTEQATAYLQQIEEVYTTGFYEDFLVPEDDFIDFKFQLDWFTFKGYLTGIDFARRMFNKELELRSEGTSAELLGPMLYAQHDLFLFEYPSTFTAFLPVDLLADVMRCSEQKKEEIRNLKWRAHGIFHVQHETETDYTFLHTATGEEFRVVKSSFNHPFDSKENEFWIATVAKWNGMYNISGLCIPSPYKGEDINYFNLEMQHSFQKHYKKYRDHIKETAKTYSTRALEFFGSKIVLFKSGNELQKKLDAFNQWYFEKMADHSKLKGDTKPPEFNLPADILKEKDIALFIPTEDVYQFILDYPALLRLLMKKEDDPISPAEKNELIFKVLDDSIGMDFWYYIRETLSPNSLTWGLQFPVDSREDFEALFRIYRPEDFSPLKLPSFTSFNSETVNPDILNRLWL